MPDHVHAVMAYPQDRAMGRTVGDWKRYHEHTLGIVWQDNFFDHRLRSDDEFIEKCSYIRMNPVRKGLCARPEEWPWIVEPWKESA
jgi:REP element-mobilizing transposase RayT